MTRSFSFGFARIPEIIFGSGKIGLLPALIDRFGKKAVFLTGRSSFTSTSRWNDLQATLKERSISFHHYPVSGEPSTQMIDDIVSDCDAKPVDLVVAIGGGSVLDAGKAVAAMIGKNESVRTFLEGVGTMEPDGTTLPFIAVPTTSGTGSECTKNAVISEIGEEGFKKSLRHDNFVPLVALVDPELTLNCPPDISAMVGMDAFTQLLESYVSTKSNPMTDALAISGLEKISLHFELMMHNPSDIVAREGMAYASMLGGITLANAGLGTVHGFASSIGGRFEIPHGVICSKLMFPCNDKTVNTLGYRNTPNDQSVLSKYKRVGKFFSDKPGKDNDYYVQGLLETIHRFDQNYCNYSFSQYGFDPSAIPSLVAQTENKNNPAEMTKEQMTSVLYSLV